MSGQPLKIAFVLPNLEIGGGVSIALANARYAAESGRDVSVALTGDLMDQAMANVGDGVAVVRFADATRDQFDVVIASWWRDVLLLPRLSARRRVHFVQGPEDLFYGEDDGPRASVRELYRIPVAAMTLSHWLKRYLGDTYAREVDAVAHPGIDKAIFATSGPTVSSRERNRLRVLVEGPLGVSYKNVVEALRLSRSIADETWLLTSTDVGAIVGVDRVFSRLSPAQAAAVYRSCDVLLKLSTVEGFGLPPLEMFHCGGTCIVFDSTGVGDFAEHGRNALVAPLGDFQAAGRLLADVRSDRELLARLQAGAVETSAGWPTEPEAARNFVESVESLAVAASEVDDVTDALRRLDSIVGDDEVPEPSRWDRLVHNRRTRSLRYSLEVMRP
jgi:glycosyl transferase family 1